MIPLLEDALREAVALPALRASIHQRLSLIVRFTEGLAAAEVHARASVELAEELADDGLRGAALAGLAIIRFNAGEPGALELAEQAHDLASAVPAPRPPSSRASRWHTFWSGRSTSSGRERCSRACTWSGARATSAGRVRALVPRCGRATRRPVRTRRRVRRPGEDRERPVRARRSRGAHGLHPDGARRRSPRRPGACARVRRAELPARRAPRIADQRTDRNAGNGRGLEREPGGGRCALRGRGDDEDTPDGAEPSMCWWRAEQTEALLELGLVDDAVDRLDAWEADARRLGRDWALAEAARCRGLVAASRGEVEQAMLVLRAVSLTRLGDPSAGPRAARARRGSTAGAAEAAGPRRDRGGVRRLREAGSGPLGGAGARGARADRWTHPHRGSDTGGAAGRRPRREGTDERRGRCGALPRRAHGRESPDPRLLQAGRALADRARPPALQRDGLRTPRHERPGFGVRGLG